MENEKTLGIICYATFVGTIIAFTMSIEKKSEYVYFHVRQMLGLLVFLFISYVVSALDNNIGFSLWIVSFICWLVCLIGAIQGKKQELPIFGKYFQKWFHTIG